MKSLLLVLLGLGSVVATSGPACPPNSEPATLSPDHGEVTIRGCPGGVTVRNGTVVVNRQKHVMCSCLEGYECLNCDGCFLNERHIFSPGLHIVKCEKESPSHPSTLTTGTPYLAGGGVFTLLLAMAATVYYRHVKGAAGPKVPEKDPFNTYGAAQYGAVTATAQEHGPPYLSLYQALPPHPSILPPPPKPLPGGAEQNLIDIES